MGESCFQSPDDLDVDAAVAAIIDGGDDIWGVSVNTSLASCGTGDPGLIFSRALARAERTGRRMSCGDRWEPDDWTND